MDAATRELLKKPRCGNPDFELSDGRRKKRFAVGHSKWGRLNVTWS